MRDAESKLLTQRQDAARASARLSTIIIVTSTLLACTAGLLAFFIIRRDLHHSALSPKELEPKKRSLMESILDNIPAIHFSQGHCGPLSFRQPPLH